MIGDWLKKAYVKIPRLRGTFFCAALVKLGPTTANDPSEWIKFSERNMRGDQSRATIQMVIKTPKWERTLAIRSDVEGKDKALSFITSPAQEKGIGTLRLGAKMWQYLPRLKRTNVVSPSLMLASWMNSDFTNDDILKASSLGDDYTHSFLADSTHEGQSFRTIEAKTKPLSKVLWPKLHVYMSREDCLPRHQIYFNAKGEIVRRLSFSEIKKFGEHLLPTRWEMRVEGDPSKSTVITYENIDYQIDFAKDHFSEKTLSR